MILSKPQPISYHDRFTDRIDISYSHFCSHWCVLSYPDTVERSENEEDTDTVTAISDDEQPGEQSAAVGVHGSGVG